MMIKKKVQKAKSQDPNEHDFTALDEAVSELSKQTAALLGPKKALEKEKPVLPKKQKPVSRGHSFDIISTKNTKKPAHLKTAVATKKEPLASGAVLADHELLPEHAGLSFNEVESIEDNKTASITSPAPSDNSASTAISGHKSGTLSITDSVTDEPSQAATPDPGNDARAAEASQQEESTEKPQPTESQETLWFEQEDEVVSKQNVDSKNEEGATDNPTKEHQPNTELDQEPDNTNPKSGSQDQTTSYESAGVYANNLVKNSEPKRYEPHENQQKPTVFDTNEYHEELHDWSKLNDGGNKKVILLLALLVIAAIAAYFFLSGQSLPF